MVRIALSLLAAACLLPRDADAAPVCTGTIASLPATISTPGQWCLAQDLGTAIASGEAIRIATPNVTIDCGGFRISGLAGGSATQAVGIHAEDKFNSVVRDCNIRGFRTAVALVGDTSGNVVEDVRSDGATIIGVVVKGDGGAVRRNRILDVGGSTAEPGRAYGIVTTGAVDVDDNVVDGVAALPDGAGDATGFGVLMQDAGLAVASGNRIRRVLAAGEGLAVGVRVASGSGVIVSGNRIAAAGVGAWCAEAGSVAWGNDFSYVDTPLAGCADGGNGVVP